MASRPPPDQKERDSALQKDASFFEAIKHLIRDKYYEFKPGDLVKSYFGTYLILKANGIEHTCFCLDNKKINNKMLFHKTSMAQKISHQI